MWCGSWAVWASFTAVSFPLRECRFYQVSVHFAQVKHQCCRSAELERGTTLGASSSVLPPPFLSHHRSFPVRGVTLISISSASFRWWEVQTLLSIEIGLLKWDRHSQLRGTLGYTGEAHLILKSHQVPILNSLGRPSLDLLMTLTHRRSRKKLERRPFSVIVHLNFLFSGNTLAS